MKLQQQSNEATGIPELLQPGPVVDGHEAEVGHTGHPWVQLHALQVTGQGGLHGLAESTFLQADICILLNM